MERVFTQTFMVVGAIIEQDGKFLLVKEAGGHDKGKWNQSAGWIDPGEDALTAVKREVKEESGLDFEPEAILGIYSIVKKRLEGKVPAGVPHAFKIIYLGTVSGNPSTTHGDTSDIQWFTKDEIDSMTPDVLRDEDIKQEVADYIAGKKYPLDLIHHTVQEKF
jgi:phosphatase NudJ